MEPPEIQEVSDHLKEAGERDRERGESHKTISLSISFLAVISAIIPVFGHRYHNQAALMQSRASDQWAMYQAKKMRADNASMMNDLLVLQPSSNAAAVNAKSEEYKAHIKKWQSDLQEEQEQARKFEEEVERAETKGERFESVQSMLQIAVILASITLYTRKRVYLLFGLALGVVSILVTGYVILL